jgi:L,D-peptidoglycan transpeptidase YkuD (ErfK/YbiS/YcfS/YnhG family)
MKEGSAAAPRGAALETISVRPLPGQRTQGRLVAAGLVLPCALGRSGMTAVKREGDGATPCGRYHALAAFWRPDRLARPHGLLPLRPIRPLDGWCDDPADASYTRLVRLPYRASAETMWRADGLYDIVVDLDWNRGPTAKGRGSAIFMHVASEAYGPTEGCIALARPDLVRLLARIGPDTVFDVRR